MLQALPLDLKIRKTQQRIREWVNVFGVDGVYVSFSGGKDSTVLLDIVRKMYGDEIKAVFIDTGLEYPEIRSFVKTFINVESVRPDMNFIETIRKYGYPFIGKEVAQKVYEVRNKKKERLSIEDRFDEDSEYTKSHGKAYSLVKWKPLLTTDFIISHMCCKVMKKNPSNKINLAKITGTMTEESALRKTTWIRNGGCNSFDGIHKASAPLSFWTAQDILKYIKDNNIKIASVYGDIVEDKKTCKLCTSKCERTGCIFCGFGAHLEKGESRFQRLKKTHPRQYEFCMDGGAYDENGIWKPTKEGLGMRHCIEQLNNIYGENFIRI